MLYLEFSRLDIVTSCCDVILLRHVTFCCEVMLPHFVLFSGFLVKSVCLCLFVIFRVLNMNIGEKKIL